MTRAWTARVRVRCRRSAARRAATGSPRCRPRPRTSRRRSSVTPAPESGRLRTDRRRLFAPRRQSASAFSRRPQRWRALGDGAELLEIVLGEQQVVRAGLARDVDAARPRLSHQPDAAAARRGRRGVSSPSPLRGRARARSPSAPPPPAGCATKSRQPRRLLRPRSRPACRQLRVLGVHRDGQPELGRTGHSLAQRRVVGRGKSSIPLGHMNALKPTTPSAASSSAARRSPARALPRTRSR